MEYALRTAKANTPITHSPAARNAMVSVVKLLIVDIVIAVRMSAFHPEAARLIRGSGLVDFVDPFGIEARLARRPARGGGGGFTDRLEQQLALVGGWRVRQRRRPAQNAPGNARPRVRAEQPFVEEAIGRKGGQPVLPEVEAPTPQSAAP